MTYYLAVDIGASSGRHILGSVQNGKLVLEEIYRFENNLTRTEEGLLWDIDHLLTEVKNGIKVCKDLNKIPTTLAIDTWGVDYVLLDKEEKEIMPVHCYRDPRTADAVKEVRNQVGMEALYARTGIQFQPFNTLYQLLTDKASGKLDNAVHFLMIPEFLSFKLTGVMRNEYTNASTTNLLDASAKTWDYDLLRTLGLPTGLFRDLSLPGTEVGMFRAEVAEELGFNCTVLLAPSHDTASAVAATPLQDNAMYISSGTWSLIGVENEEPILTEAARLANFTNEGGIDYRFRFLKNIMGMWLFQNIRRDLNKSMSYDEMMELAMKSDYLRFIDPNDERLVAPENMIEAIRDMLGEPNLPLGDVLHSVYISLARSYSNAVKEMESITGKTVAAINIIGGGSRDRYLDQLTAEYTGKPVTAGPVEGTATGNLLSQIMVDCDMDLAAARALVKDSLDIVEIK